MRLKKIVTSALALFMAIGMMPASVMAEETPAWKDGTYTGTGTGYGGDVVMEVTVKDGNINDIKAVSHEGENFWVVYESDLEEMMKKMVEANSIDVDAVSGATKSSNGIKQGVEEALKYASGWTPEPPKPFDPSFFESGTGTQEDPFVITTKEQLNSFAVSMTKDAVYTDQFVRLDSDIDLGGSQWTPIGENEYEFDGTFDGNGHTVSGMTIGTKEAAAEVPAETYWAFFTALADHACVRNLNLENIFINVKSESGFSAGGIAGVVDNSDNTEESRLGAVIDSCTVTGSINVVQDQWNAVIGGITSYLYKGAIINCKTDVDISGRVMNGNGWVEVGGITGMNNRGLVANCYTLGDVSGQANQESEDAFGRGMSIISPLVGFQAGDMATCYSKGNLTAVDQSRGAGMISGYLTMGNVYESYYNSEAIMKNAGEKTDSKPIGAQMPVQHVGLYNVAAVTDELDTFDAASYEDLADDLNRALEAYPVDVTQYGVKDAALRLWTVENGEVTFGDEVIETEYVRPAADYVYPEMKELEDAVAVAESIQKEDYSEESTKPMDADVKAGREMLEAVEKEEKSELSEEDTAAMKKTAESIWKDLENLVLTFRFRDDNGSGIWSWASDGIYDCYENGVIDGFPDGSFQPEANVTRGQFVVMLYREAGSPLISGKTAFEDLTADWYKDAVIWAVRKGIVKGTSATEFTPDQNITREQMATMMYRYLGMPETKGSMSGFSDASSVHDWAVDAMASCIETGLITGMGNNTLAPQSTATRAQAATILGRLIELEIAQIEAE